ncbi:MAG: ATP-binding cassette domain-containing protein [Candidatus Bipolaricaulia bacterium]
MNADPKTSENSHPMVEMKGIEKWFGTVHALRGVDFHVGRQEIVGLLGDNGAGKSTLVKILSGVFPPTEGEIYFEGERIEQMSPHKTRELGIETVYQDISLVNIMSVARNFFLGREPINKKFGLIPWLDKKTMEEESKKILEDIGISRIQDPDEFVSVLSGGERQAIAIGRSMYFGAELLILDEPMNALSVREQRKCLAHTEEVRDSGASVIFVTHNVYHVYPIADRFVILEQGVKIADHAKKDVGIDDVIETIATGEPVGGMAK